MYNALRALAAAVVVLGTLLPLPGWAGCKLNALEIPVTMVGGRAVATVGINGTDVKLMLDSGAFYSFLTDAAAAQLQLATTRLPRGFEAEGLTGKMEMRATRVQRLRFPKGEMTDIEFAVGGNEPGGGAMGLLGRNLLSFTDAEYDLARGVVRLMFPGDDCGDTMLAYWAGSTPVAEMTLIRDRGQKLPPIKGTASLNGKSLRVMFDTGAMSLVSLSAAQRAGISTEEMRPAGRIHGAGRGDAPAWIARVKTFELGGELIQDSKVLVADFDAKDFDMLLGIDFFLSHRVYVAKSQGKIYFTYNGGPVFALSEAGDTTASDADPPQDTAGAPVDGAGYARRGAAAAARQDYAVALVNLNRACELEPTVASHFMQRGMAQLALKQPDKAKPDFDEALRLDPLATEARLYRAQLKQESGDREGAIEDLRALDRTLAPQAHMRLAIAQSYVRLGLYDQALPQWNYWVSARPNDFNLPSVLNDRCWARAMLGADLEQALEDCNAALKQRPDDASYLDSRAWVLLRQGRYREALSDYDRALKIRPESVWSYYGRGIAHLHQREQDAGMADLESARKLRPAIDEEAARHGIAIP